MILADEMGLGKTVQAMAFLYHLHTYEGVVGPFLVIAPLSTLEHWKRTIDQWTNLNCILYYDSNQSEGRAFCREHEWFLPDVSTRGNFLHTSEINKFHVLITSNEVFMQEQDTVFSQVPFQFIVVDEAHKLKNRKSKFFQSLQ